MSTEVPRRTGPRQERSSEGHDATINRRRVRWGGFSIWQLAIDAVLLLFFLVPLLYVVIIALKTDQSFLQSPLTLPEHVDFGNFLTAWNQAGLGLQLANTVLYSTVSAAVTTTVCLFLAFPISRGLIKSSSKLRIFLVLGLFLPLAIIPLFVESQWLN